jgi:alpha-beta hydrolase superfamily lysophospholipase
VSEANREQSLEPERFQTEDCTASGLRQVFVREGAGGTPLLLVHGWPETKRIYWRVIAPLAAAGFEVIVQPQPDPYPCSLRPIRPRGAAGLIE